MKNCPDCQVKPGELHQNGCDVERCPDCGRQYISCGCTTVPTERLLWTGEWPGKDECREYGLYAKFVDGSGWVRCNKDDPEATEDLNTLVTAGTWDKEQKKFVVSEHAYIILE